MDSIVFASQPCTVRHHVSHFLSEEPPSAGDKTPVFGGSALWSRASHIVSTVMCFFPHTARETFRPTQIEVQSRRHKCSHFTFFSFLLGFFIIIISFQMCWLTSKPLSNICCCFSLSYLWLIIIGQTLRTCGSSSFLILVDTTWCLLWLLKQSCVGLWTK